jgi:ABC-type dipeptide/oligopeptide/nickel transport system permease subunit
MLVRARAKEQSELKMLFTHALRTLQPGLCLAPTVLAVNMVGDGVRDRLDPKLARRVWE